jgi:DNA-directed RNA polymerase beta' subunit
VGGESQFVRAIVDGNAPVEDPASSGARVADVDGVIHSIEPGRIHIKTADGKIVKHGLYDHFPAQSEAYFHHTPTVNVGDPVKKGSVIADSTFSKGGTLALGRNLVTAYLPYKGYGHADAQVISESAAKKLTSRHMAIKEFDLDEDSFSSLGKFRVSYPGHVTEDAAGRLDKDGVVKLGEVVTKDDPLILGLKRRMPSAEESILGKVSKKIYKPLLNSAVTWDREDSGKVVRVDRLKNKVRVYVQYDSPARIGDKLSGLGTGSKGIISKIVPDAQMPVARDGRRIEMFFNGVGMAGRVNPSMYHEAALGNVAVHDGKPFYVNSFGDTDNVGMAQAEQDKRGIADQVDLVDPETNRVIPQVGVGINHWMKLKHRVSGKFSARDTAGYDIDGQPLRGGEEGAKRTDPLQMYAILAHGAHHVLQDVAVNKSDENLEMWRNVKLGLSLPPPRPTFASEKFLSMLNAAGVNAVKTGNRITMMPLTDKEVLARSNGQVTNPGSMRMTGDGIAHEPGGLFDPAIVGGFKYGGKFSHLSLPEPFVNPVMEDGVIALTGLKRPQFDGLVSGKLGLMPDGKIAPYAEGMPTGGVAIGALLDKVDPKKEFDDVRAQLQTEKSKSTIDRLSKKGKYLRGLIRYEMSPRDAYLINHVPVIPPHYRPVVPLPNGQMSWGGLNAMYRDLMLVSDKLKAFQELGPEHTTDLRASTYDALKAVQGLGDPISNREYRGVMRTLGGVGSPKYGFIQRKLLGRPMDAVGRSTIIPDPDLGIDEVGVPEDMAWRTYQPFIVKELVRIGIPPLKAADEIDRRTSRASDALDRAMASRPALLNRAPSLHKFSVMAFNAKRVPGQAIQMPPLVFKGFNADVDGDSRIGSVIVRIGNGDPKVVDISDLYSLVSGGRTPVRNSVTKRVFSARGHNIRVLAIAQGSNVSWMDVAQVSEHFDLDMYRLFVHGIASPVVVSHDASLVTIDRRNGWQAATSPLEAFGEFCPVARKIESEVFMDSCWEDRFDALARAVSKLVRGGVPVVPDFSTGEKIRFLGLSVGIEVRMFGSGESERREILGFSMDLRAADYMFCHKTPKRLFCPQLKAIAALGRRAAQNARKSGNIGTFVRGATRHESVFSYAGRIYIEPYSSAKSGVPRLIDLQRSHMIPFTGVLYDAMMKSLPAASRCEMSPRWKSWIKRGGIGIGSDVHPAALTMFSAVMVMRAMMGSQRARESDFYVALYSMIHADVTYERVFGIKSLGDSGMTAYDLSVPDCEVFCEASGLSLKNTMMVSVPISPEAVNEAATTMMPSRNLMNPGTHGLMVVPSDESIWGVWKMTAKGKKTGKAYPDMDAAMKDYLDGKLEATDVVKVGKIETTPGRIEINSALPEKLRDYGVQFDGPKLKRVLGDAARSDPKSYDKVVRAVKASGDDASYYMGMSFGLKDLKPATVIRDRVMHDADARYRSGPATKERLLNIYGQARTVMENQLDAHYANNPNAIWDMMKSGAIGKKAQAMQMIVSPGIVNDEHGEPIPYPVGKSYSEGLGISDYMATMFGQRKGLIDRAISTAEPGEIHKETITAAVGQQIDQADCGAPGSPYELDDTSIYHRLLGEDLHVHGKILAKRNDPVTHEMVDAIRSAGGKTINVRTPLNDESAHGVCQADAGLDEHGAKYPLGFNIGALAATTISEPLTQGVLSGFHHGNTAFSKTISGLDRVRQLIELPKIAAGEGPLSSVDGTVESVAELPSGDFRVTVDGHHHFVPVGMLVQVKKGDKLTAGSPLSSGVQNPHEILRTRGVGDARKYIADELHRTYKEGNGLNLDKRHFEVIARTLSDHAYIDDPGDAETMLRGDHMPLSRVEAYNKMLVAAKKKPIEFTPVLRGAVQAAIATDDWLARTNSRSISKKLQEAAGFGLATDVGPSGHPIARYIYGVNMSGEGRKQHPNLPSSVQGLKLDDLSWHGPVAVAVHEKQLPKAEKVTS